MREDLKAVALISVVLLVSYVVGEAILELIKTIMNGL